MRQTDKVAFFPSLTGWYDYLFEFNYMENFYICMVIGRNDWVRWSKNSHCLNPIKPYFRVKSAVLFRTLLSTFVCVWLLTFQNLELLKTFTWDCCLQECQNTLMSLYPQLELGCISFSFNNQMKNICQYLCAYGGQVMAFWPNSKQPKTNLLLSKTNCLNLCLFH